MMTHTGQDDSGEYNYAVNQVKEHAKQEARHVNLAIDILLRHGYPEEDVAAKIIGACNGSDTIIIRKVLAERNLLFSKTERIRKKARRLILQGVPKEKIASRLYAAFAGSGISEIMIRKVCAELGCTDVRFANRR